MKNTFVYLSLCLFILSCGTKKNNGSTKNNLGYVNNAKMLNESTYLLTVKTSDKEYAFTPQKPVCVGGAKGNSGPLNERRFLNALLGPKGERVSYSRIGSCCGFKTPNALIGDGGLLDKYKVWIEGTTDTTIMYLNMYDADEMFIPVGYSARK
jgi:hypothetical protein